MAEHVPRKQSNAKEPNTNSNSDLDPPPSLSKFLLKSLVVVVIIVLVPLFPSRAPDSFNQNLLSRGWELVHLLVVGIAVCYGLFSRRNDDDVDKENASSSSKFENAQAYVSRLLQVSSVFDEEVETLDGSGEQSSVQTWSSQYSRNQPVVVVAADESSNSGVKASRFRNGEKPLLLPVRSLKWRILESEKVENVDVVYSRSNSGSNRRNENRVKERAEDNVVLPSPIPWRSRSGRMVMKEGVDGFEMTNSNEGFEFWPGRLESGRQISSRPSSTSSTPKSSSPSPSIDLSPRCSVVEHVVSPELDARDVEDALRRKSFYKRSPPPPAPPLPPPMFYKSHLVRSGCGKAENVKGMSSEKELKPVFSKNETWQSGMSEAKDSSRSSLREEMMRRINSSNERRLNSQIANGGPVVGKSVRTTKAGDSVGVKAARDVQEADTEKNWKDVMEAPVERIGRKLTAIDQTSARTEKPSHDTKIPNIPLIPTSMFSEPKKEEKKPFEDIVTVESDYDSDSEDDVKQSLEPIKEVSETISNVIPDAGPDVDKKADEFIAKFREQIRLQRISSIKRSANQVTGKLTKD